MISIRVIMTLGNMLIMTDVETPIKSLISTNMGDNTGTLIGQCLIPRGRGITLKFLHRAATCDFQRCGILTNVDSDEPVQPPFQLRNSK